MAKTFNKYFSKEDTQMANRIGKMFIINHQGNTNQNQIYLASVKIATTKKSTGEG